MTPTASSSSILLLNPTTPAGKPTLTTDGQATSDAGLSGFELLLGAMQQLLPISANPTAPTTESPGSEGEQGGNALPQLGILLPLSTGALPDGDADKIMSGENSETDKKDDKDDSVDIIDMDFLSFNAAQSSTPVKPVDNAASTGTATDSSNSPIAGAVIGAVETTLAPSLNTANSGSGNNNKAARTSGVSLALGTPIVDRVTGDTSALASASGDVDGASLTVPAATSDATTPVVESDFDSLIKHFESPSTQQSPTVTVGDSSQVNQASRTYANAMNSNATVSVPVGNDGWSDAVADKVMWFSANKISSAEIHLNPPDLGPLQVRVSTQHDQASVVFTSQHAAVRDALDQALPRLREMMGGQGMQLDVSVGGQNAQQQQFARNDSSDRSGAFAGFFADDAVDSKVTSVSSINTAQLVRSGFDAYA